MANLWGGLDIMVGVSTHNGPAQSLENGEEKTSLILCGIMLLLLLCNIEKTFPIDVTVVEKWMKG